VHSRTRACGFKGKAEYNTIREIKSQITIPVIANGDITSATQAAQVIQCTNADGIMIGRAVQDNPWIFREIVHNLATSRLHTQPTDDEISCVLVKHLNDLYDFYGEYKGVRIARKHIGWYSKHLHDGRSFRKQELAA
jgi:tRNA-dihydrouridine synthase B